MRRLQIKEPAVQKPKAILGPNGKPYNMAYEASSSSARLGSWGNQDISPNGVDASELGRLRNRSRSMERNTPWTTRALTANVANEIGTGIVPKPITPNAEFNQLMKALYLDWVPYASPCGNINVYGIQSLSSRSRREAGEVFIRTRQRRPEDGLPIPVQFQVIEADLCPVSFNQLLKNGNEIKQGVEFNKLGQIVAYHFYRQHPAEPGFNLMDKVRVPAEQIIHHFIPHRPGQIRGRPEGLQSFVRAYTYDQFDDAELTRKKNRAHFTGVITRPSGEDPEESWRFDPLTGEPIDGAAPLPDIAIEPGTFPALDIGEEITLFEGDKGGANDMDFARRQLLAIAAAYGLPYEILTGDYKDINDRVWRAIVNQYRRELQQMIELYTIHQICRQMWNAIVDAAVLGGVVPIPMDFAQQPFAYKRAKHTPQAWAYVHPTQDIEALKMLKDEGFDSRQGIMAGRGKDVEQIDKEREEDAKREKELGLDSAG